MRKNDDVEVEEYNEFYKSITKVYEMDVFPNQNFFMISFLFIVHLLNMEFFPQFLANLSKYFY